LFILNFVKIKLFLLPFKNYGKKRKRKVSSGLLLQLSIDVVSTEQAEHALLQAPCRGHAMLKQS
jgi:hypothetical protein